MAKKKKITNRTNIKEGDYLVVETELQKGELWTSDWSQAQVLFKVVAIYEDNNPKRRKKDLVLKIQLKHALIAKEDRLVDRRSGWLFNLREERLMSIHDLAEDGYKKFDGTIKALKVLYK